MVSLLFPIVSSLAGVCGHMFLSPLEEYHTTKGGEWKEEETSEDEGIGRTEKGKEEKRGER